MADRNITVAVPEERVAEFYVLVRGLPGRRAGHAAPRGPPRWPAATGAITTHEARAWSADDADQATWLLGKLAPPARELFELLAGVTRRALRRRGDRRGGSAWRRARTAWPGILAWPGRYSRRLGREMPIATAGPRRRRAPTTTWSPRWRRCSRREPVAAPPTGAGPAPVQRPDHQARSGVLFSFVYGK